MRCRGTVVGAWLRHCTELTHIHASNWPPVRKQMFAACKHTQQRCLSSLHLNKSALNEMQGCSCGCLACTHAPNPNAVLLGNLQLSLLLLSLLLLSLLLLSLLFMQNIHECKHSMCSEVCRCCKPMSLFCTYPASSALAQTTDEVKP